MVFVWESLLGSSFDVDGVMTNGKIVYTHDGKIDRQFNAKDGYAIKHAISSTRIPVSGLESFVISFIFPSYLRETRDYFCIPINFNITKF